jgi:DNA-binding MarR family transcriptional regulator
MPSDSSDTEIAHDVLRVIRQIVRKISAHSKQLSGLIGLTVPQLMCLKAIGEAEESGEKEITVAGVGLSVQLSAATVSRIIDRLVRVDLVTRTRAEKDRRKVLLGLTTSGLERFQNLPTPLQEQFVDRLRQLTDEERRDLLNALKRLASLMDAEAMDAAPILHPGEVLGAEVPDS